MSRWIDQFKAHPFNAQWARVQDGLNKAKVDDETIVTDVKELARLKKVVGYLDVMIRGVDPELVPLETWNNFNGQADACAGQIDSYNSNRNIGHIQNANNHADNLLTYLRPYMVGETVARNASKSSLDGYFETFIGYVESFKEKSSGLLSAISNDKEESRSLYDSINNFKADVDQLKVELFDSPEGAKWKIQEMVSDAEGQHLKIFGVYSEVVVGSDEKPPTKLIVQQARELIEREKEKVVDIVGSVENEVSEIKKFYGRVFGEKDEHGNRVGGIVSEFSGLIQKLTTFESVQRIKYEALVKEIEGLIPGATSASLATAYKEMKESFNWPIWLSSAAFYASIALILTAAFYSVFKVSHDPALEINIIPVGEWDSLLKDMVHRLPLYIPVIWLALYSTRRRSEYQRLQQEYAHKEAVAKSYISYKQQIDQLDGHDKALLVKLIDSAINAVSHNASETLDGKHGEKMPIQEVVEKALEAVIKSNDELASVVKKLGR
jgi:tetrahydromethanopterin S-methyltransferase subunit B